MYEKLLPCPFCGGEVKLMAIAGEPYPPTYEVDIANITVESDDICYVHCPTCGANWHIELRIDAFPLKTIAAWNRRTGKGINVTTNADRIRGMSDEELAEWLVDATVCERVCGEDEYCHGNECVKRVTDWLRQPVKEEHHEAD